MRLNQKSLEKDQLKVDKLMKPYQGKLVSELKRGFLQNYSQDTKASFAVLARRMFGISDNHLSLDSSEKPLILKTIRVTGNDQPAENMSFFEVRFDEWLEADSWHETMLYQYFYDTQFVFQVFQQFPSGLRVPDNQMTFKRALVWQMPDYDLEHGLKKLWLDTCHLIKTNQIRIVPKKQKTGKIIYRNNLPKSKDNTVCHLRPGGKNGKDVIMLPSGQEIARQRLWLNKQYVNDVIL
ncbi:DNA mismatch repair protein MutH [Levilactobacillus namurensis]|uniref:DNA mismatch repair protein MutH n=1 Tax=Levilactobacillus namurensis TaxID=380393 RepID=UPI0026E9E16E|nr:DNA mismatch repair protein MutH [Levilactobacillus namurensis]